MRVILFSEARPWTVWRLALRLEREAPGTSVCGVVRPRPSPVPASPGVRGALRRLADVALRWAHACPRNPNGRDGFTEAELMRRCRAAGWPVLTGQGEGSRARDFIRRQEPDLGVCLETGELPADVLLMPRLGSIAVESGPAGGELTIEVQHARPDGARGRLASFTLPGEPFETPVSRGLKVDLVRNDLLVRSVAMLAAGEAGVAPESCPSETPLAPAFTPGGAGDGGRPLPVAVRRPRWRMGLCAAALAPYCIARNWLRRLRGRCPVIVLYHHLAADRPHPLAMSTEAFVRSVRFLQRHYRILGLREAMERLASGSVWVPSVVLTLDDGYRENFLTVRAVMEETGVPVTLFVNPELIEQQRAFPHDAAKGVEGFPPLSWEQVAYLARNGAEIGSHTRSHFDCRSADRGALQGEIVGSKHDLEDRLGRPVPAFAFPWGQPENMSRDAVEIARAAYPHVFAACGGENRPGRVDPAGVVRRQFHAPDLWELELGLQSVFDLATSLRRVVAPRSRRGARAGRRADATKEVPLGA